MGRGRLFSSALTVAFLLQGCATHFVESTEQLGTKSSTRESEIAQPPLGVSSKNIANSEWRRGDSPNTFIRTVPKGAAVVLARSAQISYSPTFLKSLPTTFLTDTERTVVSEPVEESAPSVAAPAEPAPAAVVAKTNSESKGSDVAAPAPSLAEILGNPAPEVPLLPPKVSAPPAAKIPAQIPTLALQESDLHSGTSPLSAAPQAVDLQEARFKMARPEVKAEHPVAEPVVKTEVEEKSDASESEAAAPAPELPQGGPNSVTVIAGVAGLAVLLIFAVTFIAYRVRVVQDEYTRKTTKLR